MATLRGLIARPPALQVLPVDPGSRVEKQRRHRHTPTEWENRRQTIVRLYVEQHKTAEEVVEILKSEFTFPTGRRQLYNKLKEWGIQKNSRQIEDRSGSASHNIEDADIIMANAIADETLVSSEDAYLDGISFTPLTQYNDICQSREPTPAASPGFVIQSSESRMPYFTASPSAELPWPAPFSPMAIDFSTPKLLSDDNLDPPWVLTSRLASQRPGQSGLTSAKPSQTRSPSIPIRPLEVVTRDTSPVPLHLPHEQNLVAVGGSSQYSLSVGTSLKRSLSRVIEFIALKGCVAINSKYVRLKKEIKTVLDIAQAMDQEPRNYVSSYLFPSHISLSESLKFVEQSIISAPRLALNAGDLDHPSKHLIPRTHTKLQRRFRKVRLGCTTLTIDEQISREFPEESRRLRAVDGTGEWYFSSKIVLKPRRFTRALYIEVQHYQIADRSVPSIPRLSVNNIVPDTSRVFKVAANGSVQELLDIFARGQANLRDHDQYGRSLLHYSVRNPPMCRFLIGQGLDVDETFEHSPPGSNTSFFYTPLLLSFESIQLEASKDLLAAGANPTTNVTPAMAIVDIVCTDSHPKGYDMVKLILDSGHDIELINNTGNSRDLTPFLAACIMQKSRNGFPRSNTEEIIRLLLDRGSNVRARCLMGSCLHIFFRTIINPPSKQPLLGALVLLIRRGADVNSRDYYGTTVSQIAYAESHCLGLNDGGDLGSYRGDLWDAALDSCGEKISEFRKNYPRRARYTALYTRKDFEKLWEGRENSCPYWDDVTGPLGGTQSHAPERSEPGRRILCVCYVRVRWINVEDGLATRCGGLGYNPYLESDPSESSSEYGEDSDLEIIEEGDEGNREDTELQDGILK